jgi:hypothetical protein
MNLECAKNSEEAIVSTVLRAKDRQLQIKLERLARWLL